MPSPPRFPPRWRRRLRAWMRRSSVVWWAAAAALSLVTFAVVRSSLARSEELAAELGPLRPVPVVARHVDAGQAVAAGDVRMVRRPSGTVPEGTVARDVEGRVALVPLVPGEVVLASKVAPGGLRGAAALLPPGMKALSVPGGPGGRPPASIGDRVDVLATLVPSDASAAPTVVVAAGALVLAVDDETDAVTLAVSAGEAPAVAYAITAGTITLALTSP